MGKLTCVGFIFWMQCTGAHAPVIDSFCTTTSIIHPSKQDTAETKRQILAHNRKWKSLCQTPVK